MPMPSARRYTFRVFYHEMGIKRNCRILAQTGNHGHTKGQIGHEMSIHQIEVNIISAAFFNVFDFIGQAGKIG